MSISSQSSKTRAQRTAILHLCGDVEADSPGREVVVLAALTQRSGWRALIASAGGKLVQEAERSAVRHVRIPLHTRGMIKRWNNRRQLKTLMQKENPALIHAHGLSTAVYALKMARDIRIPLVIDLTSPVKGDLRARRIFEAIKRSHALVRVPSSYVAEQLRKDFGLEAKRIYYIPYGVDLQTYSARYISPERLQSLSQLWRLPEQSSVLFVPMTSATEADIVFFLRALGKISNENIFTVLTGHNKHDPIRDAAIENAISQLGLNGKVIMPDYCFDLPAACWLSSAVVAPNIMPAGQNTELLAAQAIGRPVIVTDVGANREVVSSGETAWIVPPDNVDALAKALRQALHMTTDQRLNLANTAHQFVAENFPQSAWFNGIMQMYEALLQPTGRVTGAT